MHSYFSQTPWYQYIDPEGLDPHLMLSFNKRRALTFFCTEGRSKRRVSSVTSSRFAGVLLLSFAGRRETASL